MTEAPHKFVPYPNIRYTSCVKCGRVQDHPCHTLSAGKTPLEYQTGTTKISAIQWFKNGDHPLDGSYEITVDDETMLTEGNLVKRYRNPLYPGSNICDLCGHTMHDHGWIDVPDDGLTVCPSDYVITTEDGDVYPCPAGIFATTYNIERP